MKGISMSHAIRMDEKTKQELTKQPVQETVANDLAGQGNMPFTAAQMWNRRRRSRSASAMFQTWNLN